MLIIPLSRYMRCWPSLWSRWLDICQGLFCVWMNRGKVEANPIKTQKIKRPITSHFYRTSLVKEDLLYGQKENFFLAGPMREIPNGQDGLTLPARVANQNTGFASSRPFAYQLRITLHWKLFNLKLKKSLKRQKFQFMSKSYSCLI